MEMLSLLSFPPPHNNEGEKGAPEYIVCRRGGYSTREGNEQSGISFPNQGERLNEEKERGSIRKTNRRSFPSLFWAARE